MTLTEQGCTSPNFPTSPEDEAGLDFLLNDLECFVQREEGRAVPAIGGMTAAMDRPRPLLSLCDLCGKCYSEPQCLLGYLDLARNVMVRRFLEKVRA